MRDSEINAVNYGGGISRLPAGKLYIVLIVLLTGSGSEVLHQGVLS